jgi:hypothetical protein
MARRRAVLSTRRLLMKSKNVRFLPAWLALETYLARVRLRVGVGVSG